MDQRDMEMWKRMAERNKHLADCCRDPENLELKDKKGDLTVHKCKVCGRRHFQLEMDAGKLTSKIEGLIKDLPGVKEAT